MDDQAVDGLIFDLGGVVIDWNPRHLYRKIFAEDEAKIEWFLTHVCTLDWNEKQDAGRSLRDGTAERIALFPEWEKEICAYYDRWPEMVAGPIAGMNELLSDLSSKGLRLFALSNWSGETFPLVEKKFRELRFFEQIYISANYRIVKPCPHFYRIAIEGCGIPVERLQFVDDNPRNVDAAARIGLKAILFKGAAALRQELVQLGALTSDLGTRNKRLEDAGRD